MKKGKKLCCGFLAVMMLAMSLPATAQAQDDITAFGEEDQKLVVKKWAVVTKVYRKGVAADKKIFYSGTIDGVHCTGYIPLVKEVGDANSIGVTGTYEGYVTGNQ